MKTSPILALALLLISVKSEAALIDNSLKGHVIYDLEGIISDTINEGEQTADLLRKSVTCKPVTKDGQFFLASCSIDFKVSYEELTEIRNCEIRYHYKGTLAQVEVYESFEDDIDACLQDLNESIE